MDVRILSRIASFFSANIISTLNKHIKSFPSVVVLALVLIPLFSGCYAFIHADKLTVQSSVGKKPVTPIVIDSDSISYHAETTAE